MKHTLLIISFFVLGIFLTNAQNAIPNPGFETWINGGGYVDPQGWGTINALTSFAGGTALKATAAGDIHSGNAALKLLSKDLTVAIAPGICVTGTINQQTNGVDGGLGYSLRPVSFSGWYKYYPGTGDTGSVEVTLSHWNGASRDVVGYTRLSFTEVDSIYTHYIDTIEYNLGIDPDTAVIILLSSAGANGIAGSALFLDDLAFDFPTGIEDHVAESIHVGPNPAQNSLYISNIKSPVSLELFDIAGRRCGIFNLSDKNSVVNISEFENGTYIYRISEKDQQMISTGKIMIRK